MAIERMQLPVGKKFDHNNPAMVEAAMKVLAEHGHGTGWVIQSYDPANGMLTLSRRSALTTVTKSEGKTDSYRVELMRGIKPSDGDQIAAQLESDPQHAGYFMTRFEPYISEATMSKLTPDERHARAAVATVLGVKPWDVQIGKRPGGGFTLGLPGIYVPSKHDEKLDEIVQVAIGKVGWYFRGDANKLTGEIVPSKPASFAPSIPYPMSQMPREGDVTLPPIPIGQTLAERGDEPNGTLWLDWAAAPHLQLGGITGAGKSVTLNVIIAGCLAAGAELAIIDVPQKAVDFENWRPFVRPGGWGCESLEEGATTLEQLYREGERRAELFKQYGAKKLADLPADIRRTMKEVVIVVDEVTGLFTMDAVPKRLEADDPLRMEAESKNYARELIKTFIEKIAAEQRFVGYHLVLSTQVASVSTGISTALRTNLPHKLLLGARATDGNRKLILTDVTRVPQVPDHVKVDPGASLGAGVAELAGQNPAVFKSYYAGEAELIAQLRSRGIQPLPDTQLDQTRPPASAVMTRFPDMVAIRDAKAEAAAPKFGTGPRQYEDWELDGDGKPITDPFQRANAARHALAQAAK